MNDLIGQTFGPYTAMEKLGEGGMADVYKGYQQSLNRYVAIKVLKGELAHDQEFITRFRREALAVAKLSHPNVLHVYDAGMAHGVYYIVMDYAEGGTLKEIVSRGPLPVDQAISIGAQLCDALDYAHRQGIVHRDVKPTNVLMSREGRPLLTDFGIAKALDEGTHLTRTGTSIGTPEYMAPEQAQGQIVDGRTDIYAMGIMVYEMLTGMVPFSAPTPMAALYKQINEPPPPIRQVNINVPVWLESVVNKALAKIPEERFQRAGEFASAMREGRAAAVGIPGATPPPTVAEAAVARPRERRRGGALVPILLGAIVILLLAVVGGGAYLALGGSGPDQETQTPPTAVVVVATASAVEETPEEPTAALTTEEAPTAAPDTPSPPPTEVPPTEGPEPTEAPPEPTSVPTEVEVSPTRAPTTAPTTAPPGPTKEPGVIADFESFGAWQRGDEANGSFSQSSAQSHQGSRSGKLDYNFGTSGNDYVVFEQTQKISGQPTAISAWVYGDGSGHFLNAWIKDNGGQVWQVPLGRVRHSGWQQMEGAIDPSQDWPWALISGDDRDKTVDYPVTFTALVLDDKGDGYTGSGTIYIDDLRAGTGASSASGGTDTSPTAQPAATKKPTSPPAATVTGRIAFSSGGQLYIVNAANGQNLAGPIPGMRQPDIHRSQPVIIANGEGAGKDSLWTIDANTGAFLHEQGNYTNDYRPFWKPNDDFYVYDSRHHGKDFLALYVQGKASPKKQEDVRVTYSDQHILGSSPVWMDDDHVAFSGCDYWPGGTNGSRCGIYRIPSWGGTPTLIRQGSTNDRATDGYGSQLLFMSHEGGTWDVYVMTSQGGGVRNLSSGSSSDDGLGTFSPDGTTVAFVSNRGGNWAIYAVPTGGGVPTKLFNLPGPLTGNFWEEERISWGR